MNSVGSQCTSFVMYIISVGEKHIFASFFKEVIKSVLILTKIIVLIHFIDVKVELFTNLIFIHEIH